MGDLTLLHFFLYRVLHEETTFRFYFGSSTYSSLFLIVFTKDIRSRYLGEWRMLGYESLLVWIVVCLV